MPVRSAEGLTSQSLKEFDDQSRFVACVSCQCHTYVPHEWLPGKCADCGHNHSNPSNNHSITQSIRKQHEREGIPAFLRQTSNGATSAHLLTRSPPAVPRKPQVVPGGVKLAAISPTHHMHHSISTQPPSPSQSIKQNEELQQKIQSLTEQSAQYKLQIDMLINQQSQLTSQINYLQDENEHLQRANAETEELQQENIQLQSANDVLSQQVAELTRRLEQSANQPVNSLDEQSSRARQRSELQQLAERRQKQPGDNSPRSPRSPRRRLMSRQQSQASDVGDPSESTHRLVIDGPTASVFKLTVNPALELSTSALYSNGPSPTHSITCSIDSPAHSMLPSLSHSAKLMPVPPPVPHATRPQRRSLDPRINNTAAIIQPGFGDTPVSPTQSKLKTNNLKRPPPALPPRRGSTMQKRSGSAAHQLPTHCTTETFFQHLKTHLQLPDAHLQFLSRFVEDILEYDEHDQLLLHLIDEAMSCEWHLDELLGQGGFGTVYRAHRVQPLMSSSASSSQTSRNVPAVVAMKCIDLEASEDDVSTISHEVLSLASTRSCPQLLDYYGCQVIHTSSLWLSMEYIEDGSIASQLKCHGPMVEELIAVIAREVLLGLQYMAREGKIHRDIKPGNVLVDIARAQIKLCDFGASKTLTETMAKANTLIGSPYYCAPEVLMRAEYDGRVDVWSLGVMLYECALGYCPLAHVPPVQVMSRIVSSAPPTLHGCTSDAMRGDVFSDNFVNFHKLCMMKDPQERATVQMLLRHDFVRKAKKLPSIRAMFNDRRAARRQTS